MGLFDRFFKNQKQNIFVPDFSKEEYYNCLDFIENGGTSEEWKSLVTKNGWKFKEDEYEQYQRKIKVVADKYFPQMHEIERDWSMMYKSKTYVGCKADHLKSKCEENISLYKEMAKIEREYGHEPPPNAPAFKRLAMLYEKQGEYDKSIAVCVDALKSGACGDGTPRRLERLIKKEKREPAPVEMHLINDNRIEIKEDDSIKTGRHNIPSGKIDELQKIEASEEYRQKIYKLYYFNYPEMPFISKDRELNTNWIEQASVFQNSIVKKSMMKRYSDGLLPGHIYMLYWIDKYKNKRIPSYFEYKYGINFEKEKKFLIEKGYLNKDGKLTESGSLSIKNHKEVIKRHSKNR